MALTVLSKHLPPELIRPAELEPAADWIERDLASFLAAATYIEDSRRRLASSNENLNHQHPAETHEQSLILQLEAARDAYPRVVTWTTEDSSRITPVPADHWLLIEHSSRFSVSLELQGSALCWHGRSEQVGNRHVVCYPPNRIAGTARLRFECYEHCPSEVNAQIKFLDTSSQVPPVQVRFPEDRLVLLTNRRGGMARLCLDFGAIRSKYDCLLGANLNPDHPVDRHILAKRARVWIIADGFISPLDAKHLIDFDPGPPARWLFHAPAGDGRIIGVLLEAAMLQNRNTTVLNFSRLTIDEPKRPVQAESALTYERTAPVRDVRLTVRVDIEDRNFHEETFRTPGAEHHFAVHCQPIRSEEAARAGTGVEYIGFRFSPAPDRELRVYARRSNAQTTKYADHSPDPQFRPLTLYHPQPEWCEHIAHPVEATRGLTAEGAAYSPGWFELSLDEEERVQLIVCADPDDPTAEEISTAFHSAAKSLGHALCKTSADMPTVLVNAANNFLVRRGSYWSVIAGYPWFLEWGRDALIAARGLISINRLEEVRSLLLLFGRFERHGTLPNMLLGEKSGNRDTSDAPLWYALACEEFARALCADRQNHTGFSDSEAKAFYQLQVDQNGRTIADVLKSIADWYLAGTPNGIKVDPSTALVWSPSHFTWMDTNFPACTPREGYPIEIQALWIRLLRHLEIVNLPAEHEPWGKLAERALDSFDRLFWLDNKGWFADVLLAPAGKSANQAQPSNALRSNCLIPIALGLIKGAKARSCVAAAQRYLLVPGGVRSLAPLPVDPPLPIHGPGGHLLNDPLRPYWGRYEGDEDTRRKPAYHNGTAWVWMLPVFCEALARAWDFQPAAVSAAMAYLSSAKDLLADGCLGHLPEIMDGDTPHTLRGCDAQAWSVTETARVWKMLEALGDHTQSGSCFI